MTAQFTGTLPGGQQVLVTLWDESSGELAFREGDRWGVPVTISAPLSQEVPC